MQTFARHGRRLINKAKRSFIAWLMRDPRMRRVAVSHVFQNYFTPSAQCLVRFSDHEVLVDPRDDKIAATLLAGRPWQKHTLEAAFSACEARNRLPPGSIFVDVGANIGLMTIYALLSGHFARAIAIEPEPANRALLKRNLALNGMEDRVSVVPKAVSSHDGTLPLYRDRHNRGAHSLDAGFGATPQGSTLIAVDTLDRILEELDVSPSEIGFVKIDVEGHEFDTLAGMVGLLAHHVPVMAEVTFGTDRETSRRATRRLRDLLPDRYSAAIDLEKPVPVGAQPVPSAETFEGTKQQHELLLL